LDIAMTRTRLLIVLGAGLTGLIAAVGLCCVVPPAAGITKENCARIKLGMRADEVEAVLGWPPGLYIDWRLVDPHPSGSYEDDTVLWQDNGPGRQVVLVSFGGDRRVQKVQFRSLPTPSLFQRLTDAPRRVFR
jgi:hypothetical protein